MNHSNEFDTFFQEMKNVHRSDLEKKKSYTKLQNKINGKKERFLPVLLSSITILTVVIFTFLFVINSNSFNGPTSGASVNNEANFIGIGENWIVEYNLTYPDSKTEKGVYKVTYIGKAERPSVISYEIGTSSGENFQLNSDSMTLGTTLKDGGVVHVPENIKAVIYWNDDSEQITLKEE